ncbi:MAG: DUF2155 domain-containing protein [Rickettsiales bacterium]|nr:DUF2155 domain-containing protein [Rickettsiales bacterium]
MRTSFTYILTILLTGLIYSHALAAAGTVVELRALNKVTARTSTLQGPIIAPLEFGNLIINVKACWSAPADKKPEHAALMEVIDQKPGEGPETIFSGWMFASSPALSALEHPVYDLTVVSCKQDKE